MCTFFTIYQKGDRDINTSPFWRITEHEWIGFRNIIQTGITNTWNYKIINNSWAGDFYAAISSENDFADLNSNWE